MIDYINTIVQGMQMKSHEPEGMVQSNAVLTRSNIAVITQFAQMNITINAMQAQRKTLASAPTNQKRSKRK